MTLKDNVALVNLMTLVGNTSNDETDDVNEVLGYYYPAVWEIVFGTDATPYVVDPEGDDQYDMIPVTDEMLTEQATAAAEALAVIIDAIRNPHDEDLAIRARYIRDGIVFGTL